MPPAEKVKRWTSPRAKSNQQNGLKKGFTLIELVAVITVLAVLAALVVPRIVTLRDSADRQAFFAEVRQVASVARELAQQRNETATLRYDSDLPGFTIELETEDGDAETVREIVALAEITVENLRVNGEDRTESDWEVLFFADGRSDSGSIEVLASGLLYHLRIDRAGRSTWAPGEAPEDTQKWEAGDLEQRA